MPLISIVTVSKNSARTIGDTARSVREQAGVEVEHVVKDAQSTDGTLDVVRATNPDAHLVTGRDAGIYDGMNQGFAASRGEIVAFLNSDDYYAHPQVLHRVLGAFGAGDVDVVYGDISIVDAQGREIRRWRTGAIGPRGLRHRQLPHPAVFVRRRALQRLGQPFDASYRIAGDFKQQLMLIDKLRLRSAYLPEVLTVMRAGGRGSASLHAFWQGWRECARAHREVGHRLPWLRVAAKVLAKLPGLRGAP